MKRFWISWYSGQDPEEEIPFDCWVTGESMFGVPGDEDFYWTYVADMEAESEEAAYKRIGKIFTDYRKRFCSQKEEDWNPGDRFQ